MTPDEKEAIRAHVAKGGNIGPVDAAALLAEVDRLTAQVKGFPFLPYVEGQNDERARILAAVEGLAGAMDGYSRDRRLGFMEGIAAVTAIVKGE
jgi:hypothetical protein